MDIGAPVVGGFVVATGPLGGVPPRITVPLVPVPVTLTLPLSFFFGSLKCLDWEAEERSAFPLRFPLCS